VTEGENLVVRAARLLQAQGGRDSGVEIDLEKNIPVGGGLGGGSSDCATALALLNRLWGAALSAATGPAAGIGLALGADVPFSCSAERLRQRHRRRLTRFDLPQAWYSCWCRRGGVHALRFCPILN